MNSGRSAEITAKDLGQNVFDLSKQGRNKKEVIQTEVVKEPKTLSTYKVANERTKKASFSDQQLKILKKQRVCPR